MGKRKSVKQQIAEFIGVAPDSLNDGDSLTSVVADSFALVDMAIQLQDDCGVRLASEDLRGVDTVGQLVQLIEGRIVARA